MGYTLTEIVNEFLIELGFNQNSMFARFYQFGLNFLRSKNFDTTGFPTIVELTINDNDTADLPADYVQYTKIALCSGGRLYSLGLNNNLCLDKSYDECGNPIATTDNNNLNQIIGLNIDIGGPLLIADNYRNGENLGRLFGIGSDNNILGEYRIDKTNGQIKFSGLSRTSTVIMEYLSDVESVDNDFIVHPFCVEALKSYCAWMYKVRSSKPLGEQQLAHEYYKIENRNMKQRFMSGTMDQWIAVFESGNQQTPKLG